MRSIRPFAALLAALFIHAVFAQPAKYAAEPGHRRNARLHALLSLIGDKLEIVIKQHQIGSNLNQNRRQPIPIDNPVFDSTAAQAAGNSIKRAQPNAELALLNAQRRAVRKQRLLFDERGDKIDVPEAIVSAAKQQGANRLCWS